MHKDPAVALRDTRDIAERLGKNNTVHFAKGTCPYPRTKDSGRFCQGEGHPTDCDGAYEQGDFQAFPERPTAKHVADALLTARADLSEALVYLLDLVESQQRQLQALSTKHGAHRHRIGEGHFSDRPDT